MHMDLTEHKGLIREILHRLVAEGGAAPDAFPVSQSQSSSTHTHGVKKEESPAASKAESSDDGGSSSGSGSGSSSEEEEEGEEGEEEDNGNRDRKGKQKKKKPSSSSGGGSSNKGGGFNKEHAWSEEMAAFLGVGYLSRPQVTKRLWAYIKGNNLQKPGDGRVILCDAALKTLFGVDSINMFKMTQAVNKHLRVDDREVKEEDDEEEEEDEDDSEDEGDSRKKKRKSPAKSSSSNGGASATKKNKKTSPAKKKAKKSNKADDPDKPKPKSSFPTERLSADLQSVVGKEAAPRNEVVKALWDYIKANNMQNPNDKRQIICDAKFKVIFGMDRVNGFSMNKSLKPHFLGRV